MITVRISFLEITEFSDPAFIQMRILSKLRDAGIPINGFFLFQGLKKGTLTEEFDLENKGMIYTWEE
jgi:hypothetical protein